MEYSIEDQRRLDRRDARAEGIEIGKRMKIRTEENRWKEEGREIYRISLIMKKVEKTSHWSRLQMRWRALRKRLSQFIVLSYQQFRIIMMRKKFMIL